MRKAMPVRRRRVRSDEGVRQLVGSPRPDPSPHLESLVGASSMKFRVSAGSRSDCELHRAIELLRYQEEGLVGAVGVELAFKST